MAGSGWRVIRLSEVTSTIDVARLLADEGAEHGTVVLADRQTSGRGRRGRTWTTVSGKSLAATAVLRKLPPPDRLGLAGMAAALAVVRAARDELGLELRTKWPNDVVGESALVPDCPLRKVAGTLSELHGEALLLSLGLNVNGLEADLPPALRDSATTLELLLGQILDREAVTVAVLGALDGWWRTLLTDADELLAEWRALDVVSGEEVLVRTAKGESLAGCAVGVEAGGRLLLRRADGETVALAAGDVTLRP